jgi:glutathione S-transferase
MNLRTASGGFVPSEAVRADLARIEALWSHARGLAADGPWLFGAYTAADAFYAPVAMRIAGYGLPVSEHARAYVEAHLDHPPLRRWRALGEAEDRTLDVYEVHAPARPFPIAAPEAR